MTATPIRKTTSAIASLSHKSNVTSPPYQGLLCARMIEKRFAGFRCGLYHQSTGASTAMFRNFFDENKRPIGCPGSAQKSAKPMNENSPPIYRWDWKR
jgi:hypothetical protein